MNNTDEVIKEIRRINLILYGIDIYSDKAVEHLADFKHATKGNWPDDEMTDEVDDKYQGLSPTDDIYKQVEE